MLWNHLHVRSISLFALALAISLSGCGGGSSSKKKAPAVSLLQLSSGTYTIAEGGGSMTITASRSGPSAGAVSVAYATSNGTATAGSDYTASSGTLNWADLDLADKTFTVTIMDDMSVEADETVNLTLSGPTGANLGPQATAVLTITDDDVAGTLQFSAASYGIGEAGGMIAINVTRVGGVGNAVSVDYATSDGSAVAPGDYTPAMGTLNWLAGDSTNKSFNVTIIDDGDVEGDETINLTLSNAGGGATLGSPITADIGIADNDTPPAGAVQLISTTFSVIEGGGTIDITVSRTGGSTGAVSVDYRTADNTATAGMDYNATSGTLNWLDADVADKFFTVAIIDDVVMEGDETVDLTLSNPLGGVALGTQSMATLTIVDNDGPSAGDLQFSTATYLAGAYSDPWVITVSRTGGSAGAVTVDYATSDGTALAASDYTAALGTLSWADTDTADKTFTVTITDDVLAEGNEDLNLTLSNPTGGALLGTPSAAVLTIQEGWVKFPGNPVLNPSPGPAWDDDFVFDPAVLSPASGFPNYGMWFAGEEQGVNGSSLGYASSSDGVTWVKDASNPVLVPGASGSWDDTFISGPCVLYDSTTSTYMMYYVGEDVAGVPQVGLATSTDRVTWTKEPTNPVLGLGAPGSWDAGATAFPCVVEDGGTFNMWYTGVDVFAPGGVVQIGYAASTDGVTWTRWATNPIMIPDSNPASFDNPGVGVARVIEDGFPTFRMLYNGGLSVMGMNREEVGYAVSNDGGITWMKYQDATGLPVPTLTVGAPGDWDDNVIFLATWDSIAPSELWYDAEGSSGGGIGYATHP
ncbi:MAG: hypothetical protein O7H41_02770 [Planctomycetota bacterium]|nr:hypothetical protein [Planctomycetota bacterium]